MRVLLDECVPQELRHHFPGHDVFTTGFMGWNGLKNGHLLTEMIKGGFEVLVTVDQNLPFQQHLQASGIAVILLRVPSTRIPDMLPLMPAANRALNTVERGQYVEVTI